MPDNFHGKIEVGCVKLKSGYFEPSLSAFCTSVILGFLLPTLPDRSAFQQRCEKLNPYLRLWNSSSSRSGNTSQNNSTEKVTQIRACLEQYDGTEQSLSPHEELFASFLLPLDQKISSFLGSGFSQQDIPEERCSKYLAICKQEYAGDGAAKLPYPYNSDDYQHWLRFASSSVFLFLNALEEMLEIPIRIYRRHEESLTLFMATDEGREAPNTIELILQYAQKEDEYTYYNLLIEPELVFHPLVSEQSAEGSERIEPLQHNSMLLIHSDIIPTVERPSTSLLDPMWEKIKQQVADKAIELTLYVNLQATTAEQTKAKELNTGIEHFLEQETQRCLLILGNSGSGKTLSLYQLFLRLWNQKMRDPTLPLPVFLPAYRAQDIDDQLIENCLSQDYGIAHPENMRNQELILLFDGLDELDRKQRSCSLLERPALTHWNIKKIIITSRPDVGEHYKKSLSSRETISTTELILKPFTQREINIYFLKFSVTVGNTSGIDFETEVKNILGLQELITSPYILSIVAQALPEIIVRYQSRPLTERYHLSRIDIYDVFTEMYFLRQIKRLRNARFIPDDMSDPQIIEQFQNYSREFALAILNRKPDNKLIYPHASASVSREIAGLFVGSSDEETDWLTHVRSGCLIDFSPPNIYRFNHISLLDYFSAYEIFSGILSQASSAAGYELNSTPITQNVALLDFIADKTRHDTQLETLLWDIVLQTRYDSRLITAGSNAASILNRAGISFAGKDLHGIRIPGSALNHNNSDSTNYSQADLRGVNFTANFLHNASMVNACIDGVDFGEHPLLVRVERNHARAVTTLALSPNKVWLAVGLGFDGPVEIYQTIPNILYSKTLKRKALFRSRATVSVLAFYDNNLLAVGYSNGYVRIWDIHAKKIKRTIRIGYRSVDCLHAVPNSDGTFLVLGDFENDERIKILKLDGSLYDSNIPEKDIETFSINPQGTQIAIITSITGNFSLWSLHNNELLYRFRHRGAGINNIDFSYDGNYIAFSCSGRIKLWRPNQIDPLFCTSSDSSEAEIVKFSPMNLQLASSMRNNSIYLWTIEEEELVLLTILQGHQDTINALLFFPDELYTLLLSGATDCTTRIRSIENASAYQRDFHKHKEWITGLDFFSATNEIVSVGSKEFYMWNANDGDCTGAPLSAYNFWAIQHLGVSECFQLIVLALYDELCGFNPRTSERLYRIKTGDIKALAVNARGDNIATAIEDMMGGINCIIKLFHTIDGRVLRHLSPQTQPCTNLRFSLDDRHLISLHQTVHAATSLTVGGIEWISSAAFIPNTAEVSTAMAIQWQELQRPSPLSIQASCINTAEWRPNYNNQIVLSIEDYLLLCEITYDIRPIRKITKEYMGITRALAFHPDGILLASTSANTIHLWNVENGHRLFQIHAFHDLLTQIKWLPNNRFVAAGWDSTIKCFDVERLRADSIAPIRARLAWTTHPHLECFGLQVGGATGAAGYTSFFKQRYARGDLSTKRSEDILRSRDCRPAYDPVSPRFAIFSQEPRIILTADTWAVSLVRKRNVEHAFLLIERMENGQYIFERADLFLDLAKPSHFFKSIGSAHIEFHEVSAYELALLAEEKIQVGGDTHSLFVGRSHAISAEQGKALRTNIIADYNRGRTYVKNGHFGTNCIRWIEEHLNEIGVSTISVWSDIFAYVPSAHVV